MPTSVIIILMIPVLDPERLIFEKLLMYNYRAYIFIQILYAYFGTKNKFI